MTFTNIAGGQNWDQNYAGTGTLDSTAQVVKSISDGDWASAFTNAGATAIGLLDIMDNPIKVIGTTVVGWLLEHIPFLDAFLDQTAGDANAVQAASQQFFEAAQTLDGIAADQITVFGTKVDTYRHGASQSAHEFEKRVGPRGEQLKTLALQCYGLGEAMNRAAAVVGACRGIIRDLLAEFTWWVLKKATAALASATWTAGGSLAVLATDTCVNAANLARKLTSKLSALAKDLSALRQLVAKLFTETVMPIVGMNAVPSGVKGIHDSAVVDLTAADQAEQQVAKQDADEERHRQVQEHGLPLPVPGGPAPVPKDEPYGPGLGVKWTASGTLDE